MGKLAAPLGRVAGDVRVSGATAIELPAYIELERATRPARVVGKLQRYSGRYLRMLDEKRCVIRPIVIVHHDPRSDWRRGEKKPGAGAHHLSMSLTEALYSSIPKESDDGDADAKAAPTPTAEERGVAAAGGDLRAHSDHFTALYWRLKSIDQSLDLGRIVLVMDWAALRAQGMAAYGYTLAPHAVLDGDGQATGEQIFDVRLDPVAREWSRMKDSVEDSMEGER